MRTDLPKAKSCDYLSPQNLFGAPYTDDLVLTHRYSCTPLVAMYL